MDTVQREHKRLVRLRQIEEHDPQLEDLLLNLVVLTADILDVDYAAIHYIYEDHQESKVSTGLSLPNLRRKESICHFTIEAASSLVIEDLNSDSRTSDFWYVQHPPKLKSYAGVPLITRDGYCPGTLCVMDTERRAFTDQDVHRLMSLGEEVIDKLEMYTSKSSSENRAESREWMIREIHHRLKNNLAIISGIMDLEYMRNESEQIREMLLTMQQRIQSIANVHRKLYESESLQDLSLVEYVEDLVARIEESYLEHNKSIRCVVEGEDFRMKDQNAVTIGLLINEMVTNAFKHAFNETREGTIKVTLQQPEESCYKLIVEDDGDGLPSDFNMEESNSLGVKLIQTLTRQLNADLHVEAGTGTRYVVEFTE